MPAYRVQISSSSVLLISLVRPLISWTVSSGISVGCPARKRDSLVIDFADAEDLRRIVNEID